MQKSIPLVLFLVACFSGCRSTLIVEPPLSNPRVTERDLGPRQAPVAIDASRRIVNRALTSPPICGQNKETGKYELKTPGSGDPSDCAHLNAVPLPSVVPRVAAVGPLSLVTPVPAKVAPVQIAPQTTPTTAQSIPPGSAIPLSASVRPTSAPIPAPSKPQPAAQPVDPATVARTYTLKHSDRLVRLALQRWLKEVGMQLAYEAPNDFAVPAEGNYTGTISEVLFKLMTSLKKSSYPLRACEYDNRLVLVVHRDAECPLEDE
jgi:hypothetical protein